MKAPFSNNWPITQRFGEHPEVYKQFGLKGHNGLDYGCPSGTWVLAAAAGAITRIAADPQGYGIYIMLEHPGGYQTLYGHLQSTVGKAAGQVVTVGQMIGLSDSTGFSTGPHLHFEVRLNGVAIDPETVLEAMIIPPPPLPDPIPEPAPAPAPAGAGDFEAAVTVDTLNIRSGPGLDFPILRQVKNGQRLTVKGFAGDVLWVQLAGAKSEYCAFRWNGTNYLKQV